MSSLTVANALRISSLTIYFSSLAMFWLLVDQLHVSIMPVRYVYSLILYIADIAYWYTNYTQTILTCSWSTEICVVEEILPVIINNCKWIIKHPELVTTSANNINTHAWLRSGNSQQMHEVMQTWHCTVCFVTDK